MTHRIIPGEAFENEIRQSIITRLVWLTGGTCSCGTMTPELKHHAERCNYRIASEALELARAVYTSPPSRSSIRAEALKEVEAERERQKAVEGWTEEHDDNHVRGEMALAAACYAVTDFPGEAAQIAAREVWPWEDKWWKPKDFRRNLVRAGALIVAEIERHDRIAAKRPSRSPANE